MLGNDYCNSLTAWCNATVETLVMREWKGWCYQAWESLCSVCFVRLSVTPSAFSNHFAGTTPPMLKQLRCSHLVSDNPGNIHSVTRCVGLAEDQPASFLGFSFFFFLLSVHMRKSRCHCRGICVIWAVLWSEHFKTSRSSYSCGEEVGLWGNFHFWLNNMHRKISGSKPTI